MPYRLTHLRRADVARIALAEHVDPLALKQHGYESARALGDAHALWLRSEQPGVLFELRCRGGDALLIEKPATH